MEMMMNDLRSALVSPQPGMDQSRGVPGNQARSESKTKVRGFEDELKALDPSPSTQSKSESKLVKEDTQPTRNVGQNQMKRKSAVVTSPESDESSGPVDKKPKAVTQDSKVDDREGLSEDSVDEKAAVTAPLVQEDPAAKLVEDLLNPQAILLPNREAAKTPETEQVQVASSDVSETELKLPSLKANLEAPAHAMEHAALKAVKNQEETKQLDSLMKELDQTIKPSFQSQEWKISTDQSLDESSGAAMLPLEKEAVAPSRDLKSMVQTLWVQESLNGAASAQTLELIPQGDQVLKTDTLAPHQVRINLVDDMKPLISQVMRTKQGGEMTLSLRPADLGMIKVELKVDADSVKVMFQTEQVAAKDMLKGQMGELKNQLAAVGLNVQDASVSVMKHSESSQNRDPSQQQRHSHQEQQAPTKDDRRQKSFDEWAYLEGREVA